MFIDVLAHCARQTRRRDMHEVEESTVAIGWYGVRFPAFIARQAVHLRYEYLVYTYTLSSHAMLVHSHFAKLKQSIKRTNMLLGRPLQNR